MTQPDPPLRTTPLTARHRELGGRMVPFAGYSMPVQFTGVHAEHETVRANMGMFDVSHMGEVEIQGKEALAFVNTLITHDAGTLKDGDALYTVMCHPTGGVVDDLLVYRLTPEHVLLCINASNRHKDFDHIRSLERPEGVSVEDTSDSWAQLAIQGPNALALLATLCTHDPRQLAPFSCRWDEVAGHKALVSRTGYTGEDGVELYVPVAHALTVHDAIWEKGRPLGLALCGLGCRDTLRLEAKMHLYGQDLTDTTTPLEAGLAWAVKFEKDTFLGKDALMHQKSAGIPRLFRGLVLEGRAIARTGAPLFCEDTLVGHVTSGCYSPTLGQSIALGYIDADFASRKQVDVEIRGKRIPASVTKKPFYRRP